MPLEGLEPPTLSLGRNCSSIELQRLTALLYGAGLPRVPPERCQKSTLSVKMTSSSTLIDAHRRPSPQAGACRQPRPRAHPRCSVRTGEPPLAVTAGAVKPRPGILTRVSLQRPRNGNDPPGSCHHRILRDATLRSPDHQVRGVSVRGRAPVGGLRPDVGAPITEDPSRTDSFSFRASTMSRHS